MFTQNTGTKSKLLLLINSQSFMLYCIFALFSLTLPLCIMYIICIVVVCDSRLIILYKHTFVFQIQHLLSTMRRWFVQKPRLNKSPSTDWFAWPYGSWFGLNGWLIFRATITKKKERAIIEKEKKEKEGDRPPTINLYSEFSKQTYAINWIWVIQFQFLRNSAQTVRLPRDL